MEESFFVVMGNKKSLFLVLFLFVLVISVFLRFHNLDDESLWVDEAFTDHYMSGNWDDLITVLKNDVHPIGFYALEYFWVNHFGTSEFSLRFLPFVFGSLSVVVFFFAVCELYERRTALLSTLFLSLSYTFILYSQEAKMYGQFMFFFFMMLLFLVKFLKKPSWFNTLLLMLGNIGLLHTHILSVPIIFTEAVLYVLLYVIYHKHEDVFFLCFKKKAEFNLGRFCLMMGLVAGSYLFWLPVFYYQFHRLFLDMLPFKFNQKFGFDGFYMLMLLAILVVISVVALLLYVAASKKWYLRVRKHLSRLGFPSSLFVMVFLVWLLMNVSFKEHFFGNLFYVRYLLFLFPFWYIVSARKLDRLRWGFALLLGLYLLASVFVLHSYYTVDGKEQWREAVEYVNEEAGVNDVLLFHTAGHTHWAFNYYYDGSLPQVKLKVKDDSTRISSALQGKDYAFLVLSHNYETKEYFTVVMSREYRLVESREFVGVKVYKYEVGHG